MSGEEDPEADSKFADELYTDEPDFRGEESDSDTSTEFDEWTGFNQSSEVDEGPIPPLGKLQETATVTPNPQPVSKYVPPHLRKAATDVQTPSSESLVRLTKQLKGLLNRYATYLPSLLFTLTESSA